MALSDYRQEPYSLKSLRGERRHALAASKDKGEREERTRQWTHKN
jgi:hypothetical protein